MNELFLRSQIPCFGLSLGGPRCLSSRFLPKMFWSREFCSMSRTSIIMLMLVRLADDFGLTQPPTALYEPVSFVNVADPRSIPTYGERA